ERRRPEKRQNGAGRREKLVQEGKKRARSALHKVRRQRVRLGEVRGKSGAAGRMRRFKRLFGVRVGGVHALNKGLLKMARERRTKRRRRVQENKTSKLREEKKLGKN